MQLSMLYQGQNIEQSSDYISESHLWSVFNRCQNPYQFSVHLARILFSPEEMRVSNCRGVKCKKALEKSRLNFIKHVVMKFYHIPQKCELNVWKQCIQSIDTRCRHERRYSAMQSFTKHDQSNT